MALVMTPIYTQTASGSVTSITFNNIPQYYTDLLVKHSTRSTAAQGDTDIFVQFNGDNGNNYSGTRLYGQGSSVGTDRQTNTNIIRVAGSEGTTATANTFASGEFYIPNYSGTNYKQIIVDAVEESNTATGFYMFLSAMQWRSTSAITSLSLLLNGGNYTANSTFSLYGIIRYGA